MDSGNTPTGLYIDLSKAFDTLSFDIILQKLKHYGVMGTELRLTVCPEVEKTKMDNFLLFNIWGIYLVENTLNYHKKKKH